MCLEAMNHSTSAIQFDGNVWYTYLIYSLIAFVAFWGNALVIYIFVTRPSYFRSSCNIFICSLAITDVITSIMLVFSRYLYLPAIPAGGYISKDIYCKVIWSPWVLFTLGYISIYTCLALAIERWMAVIKPFTYRHIKPKRTMKMVVLVWIVGVVVNLSTLFRVKFDEVKLKCIWTSLKFGNRQLPWIAFSLQTVLPFSIIVVLYTHIFYVLRRRPAVDQITGHSLRKTITKMTLATTCALIIGWLPSRVNFTLSKFGDVETDDVLHFCLVMFSFSNSCINPFLYNVYYLEFRKDCKNVFSNLFSCRKQMCSQSAEGSINASDNIILKNLNS